MGSKSSKPEPKPEPKPTASAAPQFDYLNWDWNVSKIFDSLSGRSQTPTARSTPTTSNTIYSKPPVPATPKFDWSSHRQTSDSLEFLVFSLNQLRIEPPERSRRDPQLFNIRTSQNVTYADLAPYDWEYRLVSGMITNKHNFKVDNIQKIVNPYLETAFDLKTAQKVSQFPYVEEILLFHGTKQAYVDQICETNFNWRLCKTHKFGKGISFSPNSTYASNYSDKNVYQKVMIVAKVLIANSCQGDATMILPPKGFDTTVNNEGIVTVKFEDNEFCPVYKIEYHLMKENSGRGRGRGNARGRRSVARRAQCMDCADSYDYDLY